MAKGKGVSTNQQPAEQEYTLDPRNARRHPARNLESVEASLRELGAGRSIVVDADGVVIGGNAVYEKAVELGIPVKTVETDGRELVVVRRTDFRTDDPRRKALALADNQIGTLAEWDVKNLDALLAEIDIEGIGFAVMGFGDAVKAFGQGENDPNSLYQGMPAFNQGDEEGFRIIYIHFRDQEAVDRFAQLIGQKLTPKTRYVWYPEAAIDKVADLRFIDTRGELPAEGGDANA